MGATGPHPPPPSLVGRVTSPGVPVGRHREFLGDHRGNLINVRRAAMLGPFTL